MAGDLIIISDNAADLSVARVIVLVLIGQLVKGIKANEWRLETVVRHNSRLRYFDTPFYDRAPDEVFESAKKYLLDLEIDARTF